MKRPVSESRAQDRNPSKGSADPKAEGGDVAVLFFSPPPEDQFSLQKKQKLVKSRPNVLFKGIRKTTCLFLPVRAFQVNNRAPELEQDSVAQSGPEK